MGVSVTSKSDQIAHVAGFIISCWIYPSISCLVYFTAVCSALVYSYRFKNLKFHKPIKVPLIMWTNEYCFILFFPRFYLQFHDWFCGFYWAYILVPIFMSASKRCAVISVTSCVFHPPDQVINIQHCAAFSFWMKGLHSLWETNQLKMDFHLSTDYWTVTY